MSGLKERFFNGVFWLKRVFTSYTATNTTTDIALAKVGVPSKPEPGTVYKIKLAGSKSGANAAMLVKLKLGSTTIMTLTADDGTAVDWVAEFTVIIVSAKAQRTVGHFLSNTADPEVDYAATTVDLSAGADLVPQITSAHASDVVTCAMCTVEGS